MQDSDAGANELTPERSWATIHATMDDARSSMYVAGSTVILVLWAAIVSVGYFSQYAIETLAEDFAERRPWYPGPLWGTLVAVGMVGSATIGHRAGRRIGAGDAVRSAGIRVFLFWLAIMVAAFLIPGAAGLWTDDGAEHIPLVVVGIVALGYILFGIMHRPLLAAVGVGLAATFYIPFYLAGDAAPAVSGVATLAMAALALLWIRRTGEW